MLKENIKFITDYIAAHKPRLTKNGIVFEILEGNIEGFIKQSMQNQMSKSAFDVAKRRIPPINILKKTVKKLTRLYSQGVERTTDKPIDQALIDDYSTKLDINVDFGGANNDANAYKYSALKIYVDSGELKTKVVPANTLIPYSHDRNNPTVPTMIIEEAGSIKNVDGSSKAIYHVYTDEEFLAITQDGEEYAPDMAENEGVNPFGVIPYSYISYSRNLLIPRFEDDIIAMPILIPLLCAEINYASQFLSSPIVYGIDLNVESLKMTANSFWNLKSDQSLDKEVKPELNVLQPNLDIASQSSWIQELLAFWLESKDIQAGSFSTLNKDNMASGIHLMIKEMDTTNNVKLQAIYFKAMERDFWNRLATIHNVLSETEGFLDRRKFSTTDLNVQVTYEDAKPLEDRGSTVARLKLETEAGFLSIKSAIGRLNPEWDQKQINKEVSDILSERSFSLPIIEVKDA